MDYTLIAPLKYQFSNQNLKYCYRMKKLLFVWLAIGIIYSVSAQCSETANPVMKKYAELTRNSANSQSCSMCAWLANLFCIAENGLYENDKAGVESSINQSKANIKQMGDPICCPELLTKTIQWGKPDSNQNQSNNAETSSDIGFDIQKFVDDVNSAVATVQNLNAIGQTRQQLMKEIENVERLMNENKTLSNIDYYSENEIINEYNIKLANLNKLAEVHLTLKTKMKELGYETSGELINNSNTFDLGLIVGMGALANQDVKESKEFSEEVINHLNASKKEKIIGLQVKKAGFDMNLIPNQIQEYFSKSYGEDFSTFLSHSIIEGYTAGMNLKDFKKLYPNYKWKKMDNNTWSIINYNNESKFYFTTTSKSESSLIKAIEQKDLIAADFSAEKLFEFQQKILNDIKHYNQLFDIKPESYNFNDMTLKAENIQNMSTAELTNFIKLKYPIMKDSQITELINYYKSNPELFKNNHFIDFITEIHWSDYEKKSFKYGARLMVVDDIINLIIVKNQKSE